MYLVLGYLLCFFLVFFLQPLWSLQDEAFISSGYFSIQESSLTVVSPNGSELWPAGEEREVLWVALPEIKAVRIEYSLDAGKHFEMVTASTPNTGRFVWRTGLVPSMNGLIRISTLDGSVSDTSDHTFTLTPPMSFRSCCFEEPVSWGSGIAGKAKRMIGDFNGDGKDDLLIYAAGEPGVIVLLSDGAAFINSGYWTDAEHGADGWAVGDFNGDGKDDLMRYFPGGAGSEVFLSNGTRFVKSGSWTGVGNGTDGWTVGDFNGDGKDDLLRYIPGVSGGEVFLSDGARFVESGSWTGAGNGTDGWIVGDFNGDGKDDLLRYLPGESGGEVFLSDGARFVESGSWTGLGNGREGWFSADFNGDGKADLMRYLRGMMSVEVLLSSGSSFVYDGAWSKAGMGDGYWLAGDFNGDGRGDLLRFIDRALILEVLSGSCPDAGELIRGERTVAQKAGWIGDLPPNFEELNSTEEMAFLEYLKRNHRSGQVLQVFQLQTIYEHQVGRGATRAQMIRLIKKSLISG